ncbi:CRAL/TRIO domain-containing protein [Multifurca ochricompacta]|uniref:CRAL/TRIO domain-containing protein n=1 Tax=Multifurca ochricompacta TaxID=376703 RepID=A0AAD4QEB7_9AGAM|nr:CRAL/TRIO domain-containing protein [Multifurca ochricompacta]
MTSPLDELKRSLEHEHLYKPPSDSTPASHDDATLLRFLRARKFDPIKAHKQFAATEAWRSKNNVLQLYATFDQDEFESAKRFYPRWTGRRDKHGIPVFVFRLASLTAPLQKELNAIPEERRYQRIVALWEFMSRFTLPFCSALPRPSLSLDVSTTSPSPSPLPSPSPSSSPPPLPPPITATTSIIDLGGISLGTMWSLRRHLQQASELATAHYPETLHTIAVVNAPAFFPTVWNWIKVWFDEGTRNKVHVLGADPGPALLQLMDADSLPQVYGGALPFTFEDEPVVDIPARELLGSNKIPRGPVVFLEGKVTRPEGYTEPQYIQNGT